jgi:geranylgeranyl pyrophosphate synthase
MSEHDIAVALERELNRVITEFCPQGKLLDACLYSVIEGGKRIRPRFLFALAEDFLIPVHDILPYAVALELLHAATLIHDDLPEMDNDDVRRGRPTNHRVYGHATALLAGDTLPAIAFTHLATCSARDPRMVTGLELLSKAFVAVCNGQQLDITENRIENDVKIIHRYKTGAFFKAAAQVVAVHCNVAPKRAIHLENSFAQMGEEFGVLFQEVDDFLDLFGSEAVTGRPSGSDARNKRSTYFSTRSREEGIAYLQRARCELEKLVKTLASERAHALTTERSQDRSSPASRTLALIELLCSRMQ